MWRSRRLRPRPARSRWWQKAAWAGAACPGCGRFSGRVHDRYQRRLRDLPLDRTDPGLCRCPAADRGPRRVRSVSVR
ncbi:transposase family protein [[Kitasatospora] papulosa]|uniref:transposase family protein n=1 Tax=[Kitasatospora] papulosa TaxID=1464011 RepID=UPI001EFD0C30